MKHWFGPVIVALALSGTVAHGETLCIGANASKTCPFKADLHIECSAKAIDAVLAYCAKTAGAASDVRFDATDRSAASGGACGYARESFRCISNALPKAPRAPSGQPDAFSPSR